MTVPLIILVCNLVIFAMTFVIHDDERARYDARFDADMAILRSRSELADDRYPVGN